MTARDLPAWSYFNTEMLEMEKDLLFRSHWQLVCHVNDLPEPGDFVTLDCVGERALVIRGKDGVLRGFHNLCRHRGSRVVAAEQGNCRNAIVCPFHGWVYNLDGTLRGAAQPEKLPGAGFRSPSASNRSRPTSGAASSSCGSVPVRNPPCPRCWRASTPRSTSTTSKGSCPPARGSMPKWRT